MRPEDDPYLALQRMQAEAGQALSLLDALPRPADPATLAQLQKVYAMTTAYRDRTRAPITIGLVGEFSVGKSRLLGTLFGLPDLLPHSTEPTTGNITALRLRPADGTVKPGHRTVSVSYLSRRSVAEAARYILDELVKLVQSEQLSYDVRALHDYNPVEDGWDTFERLARTWWHDANLELRQYAWELLKLRDALDIGENLLDPERPGRDLPIPQDDIDEAVRIGPSRRVPDLFPERRFGRAVPHDAAITADLVQATFVLIRRVTYDVAVDPRYWDVSGFKHSNGVIFLDFPGLNALGCARDEFLCRMELRNLTSFVEVLAADRPETKVATKFEVLLEGSRLSRTRLSESVLIVANKFDKIAPVYPREPMTLTALGRESSELDSLLRTVTQLSRQKPSRVTFTSTVPDAARMEWGAAISALHAGNEHVLADILRGYATDCGISTLRDRLSRHLRTEALPIEVAELVAMRTELRAQWRRLQRMLSPEDAGELPESDRRLLNDLLQALHRALDELEGVQRELLDPAALPAPDVKGEPASLFHRIGQEAVLSVYRWEQWESLIHCIDEGRIAPAKERKRTVKGLPGLPSRSTKVVLPDTALDFRPAFVKSLTSLREEAQTIAIQAVEEVLAAQTGRTAEAAALLQDARTRALLLERLSLLDPEGRGEQQLETLEYIVNPSWIPQACATLLNEPAENTDSAFPLADDQLMPWHPALDGAHEILYRRHHSRVHLLRHEMADALAHPVRVWLATAFTVLTGWLGDQCKELRKEIPSAATLFSGGPGAPADPDAAPLADPFDPDHREEKP